MVKKFGFLFIVCTLVLVVAVIAKKSSPAKVVEQTDLSSRAVFYEAQGPSAIDDCLLFPNIYRKEDSNLISECTSNYVHFFPNQFSNKKTEAPTKVRIGSFNMFHVGDNQAPLKSFEIMARIGNRWDLIGAQELMPLAAEDSSNNSLIALLNKKDPGLKQSPIANWTVAQPGYMKLLRELRKLDDSWALLLQSIPAGEGSSGEMAGFYYRASVVNPVDWGYCPMEKSVNLENGEQAKNLGCLVQVREENKKLISRTAFTGYFKSGDFDFVALTVHHRFRPADPAQITEQQNLICPHVKTGTKCKIAKDAIGRFFEVYAIAEQVDSLKFAAKDEDLIFMGDYNLELNPFAIEYWKAALIKAPGFVPFQKSKTTLSTHAKTMASSYDHFILDPTKTRNCDLKSIRAYNIVEALQHPATPEEKMLAQSLTVESRKNLLEKLKSEFNSVLRYQVKNGSYLRTASDLEKADYEKSLSEAYKRSQTNQYASVLELVSDHIPIEMDCLTH